MITDYPRSGVSPGDRVHWDDPHRLDRPRVSTVAGVWLNGHGTPTAIELTDGSVVPWGRVWFVTKAEAPHG